jgi:succinyl-CoA synthetase beta subunit
MKIHEYQARQLLSAVGVPVPPAEVVRTPEAAGEAFLKFNAPMCVVKAQVYAGGRGKAGFVKLVKSAEEARAAAKFMLSNRMVSYQTGAEGAVEAFRIILSDPKVKGILVNIFGGIAKCDLIAEALVKAGREVGFKVPVVVRLEGTNVDKAREILNAAKAELPTLVPATDLTDAAKKVVAATAKAA